ncbi:unnamed protein product [Clavelina lepadiformis]|uniref:Uncharacterized protein n=1 Tax=Clavelina lepadiformis TaxID=159417 RepID=A0ABP0G4E2_CLALP
MICRRCKTVRSAKLSRVTNEHGRGPDQPGSYSQQTRLLRDDGRPAFLFTRSPCTSLLKHYARGLHELRKPSIPDAAPAIRVQYSRRGTPIACHWIRQTAQNPG